MVTCLVYLRLWVYSQCHKELEIRSPAITLRFYFLPIRMVKIKISMTVHVGEDVYTFALPVRLQNGATILEINLAVPLKIVNSST